MVSGLNRATQIFLPDNSVYDVIAKDLHDLAAPVIKAPQRQGPPEGEITKYQTTGLLSLNYLGNFNPDGVTYQQLETMHKNGLIRFVLAIRKMPIVSIFRKPRGIGEWRIVCENEKIRNFLEAAFDRIRMRFVRDSLDAVDWGFVPFERVYEHMNAKMLGVRGNDEFWVYNKLKPNHPKNIKIRFDSLGGFDGYEQNTTFVPPDKALIITHDKKYGNYYGNSSLVPIFPFWFWFEAITRSMLRYLERMGSPLTVSTAPQQSKVTTADGASKDALDWALQLAIDAGKSNAVALPSDLFRDSREKMWTLSYLEDKQRGNQFVAVLQWMAVQVMRAGLLPERVATQDNSTGSYGMSQTHFDVFMQTEEELLAEMVEQFNDFLFPPLTRYNFGHELIMAQMTTDGLDRSEKDRMFNLLRALVNVHPDVVNVDLAKMTESLNIPYHDLGLPTQEPAKPGDKKEKLEIPVTPGVAISVALNRFIGDVNKNGFLNDRDKNIIRQVAELVSLKEDPDLKVAVGRLVEILTPEKIREIVGETMNEVMVDYAA